MAHFEAEDRLIRNVGMHDNLLNGNFAVCQLKLTFYTCLGTPVDERGWTYERLEAALQAWRDGCMEEALATRIATWRQRDMQLWRRSVSLRI